MQIPTRRIRYIDGGHEADINVDDFDEALHEEPNPPQGGAKPKPKPRKPRKK